MKTFTTLPGHPRRFRSIAFKGLHRCSVRSEPPAATCLPEQASAAFWNHATPPSTSLICTTHYWYRARSPRRDRAYVTSCDALLPTPTTNGPPSPLFIECNPGRLLCTCNLRSTRESLAISCTSLTWLYQVQRKLKPPQLNLLPWAPSPAVLHLPL